YEEACQLIIPTTITATYNKYGQKNFESSVWGKKFAPEKELSKKQPDKASSSKHKKINHLSIIIFYIIKGQLQ
ncbi:MAG: hypothetical protein WKF89_15000, partial [Chitinophagaceae bacterium]